MRAGALLVWDETTSFYFVETRENSTQFAERVIAAAGLRDHDLLVVVNMNGTGSTIWGAFTSEPMLQHFLRIVFRARRQRGGPLK